MIPTSSITIEEISRHEQNLLDAFQKSDLISIETYLHDDALFVYPNGLLLTKSQVLDNYRSGNSAFNTINTSDQEIKIINKTAVVSVVMELDGMYKDQIIKNKFRYIGVWELFADGWKVIATSGVQL
jgi:ketosteroid isomerase-like protein